MAGKSCCVASRTSIKPRLTGYHLFLAYGISNYDPSPQIPAIPRDRAVDHYAAPARWHTISILRQVLIAIQPRLCPDSFVLRITYSAMIDKALQAYTISPDHLGATVRPGRTETSRNQGKITRLGPDAAVYFYSAPHHRQSRQPCEIPRAAALPGNIATPCPRACGGTGLTTLLPWP